MSRAAPDAASRAIATAFGLGRLPLAPGTWASAAAVPAAALLHGAGGTPLLAAAIVLAALAGLWAVARVAPAGEDPAEVVVDEVVGAWLALLPAALAADRLGAGMHLLWPWLLADFALFRLFDILKPWPVSWADGLGTPAGVMLDDVLAGLLAATCAAVPGWLLLGTPGP